MPADSPTGSSSLAVLLEGVSKTFRKHTLSKRSYSTLKSSLLAHLLRRNRSEFRYLQALKNFGISVPRGQSLGVIGRNGSGKSTLLKLIAGIYRPDTGCVCVSGRVAALIELGAGFHPDFTGRENIYLGGVMFGLTRRQIESRMDEIVRFAELEEFIDDPVRTYSSGMYMRLGFSLAVHTDPEVLLVDEVLAVGDAAFIHRCQERISEFKRQGKTMILVTHDLDSVLRWCDCAVWLDKGEVRALGDPRRVIDRYLQDVEEGERVELDRENEVEPPEIEELDRWGDREVEITGVAIRGSSSGPGWLFQAGESIRAEIEYLVHRPVEELIFGIGILRADGTVVFGTNTDIEQIEFPLSQDGGRFSFSVERLGLTDGTYFLDVAAHRADGYPYDYHHLRHKFSVRSSRRYHGVWCPEHRWEFPAATSIQVNVR